MGLFGIKLPKIKMDRSTGALLGGAAGFAVGGPWGAAIGAGLGGSLGKGGSSGPGAPKYKGPNFAMRKTDEFIKDQAPVQIGPARTAALSRRYQTLRQNTANEANAAQGKASDAISRRFASIGASGSGSRIKLEQQMMQDSEEQKQKAIQAINEQEASEIESRETQRDMAQADMDFRQRVFNFERGSKLHELDLAERGQKISQAENEYAARLNQFINQPPKKGLLSGILDGLL